MKMSIDVVQFALVLNYLWPILIIVFLGIKYGRLPAPVLAGALLGFAAVVVISWPEQSLRLDHNIAAILCAYRPPPSLPWRV